MFKEDPFRIFPLLEADFYAKTIPNKSQFIDV